MKEKQKEWGKVFFFYLGQCDLLFMELVHYYS